LRVKRDMVDWDKYWMKRALSLAGRVKGRTHPNPSVGCVLARGATRIGEGYHHGPGKPHAEVEALRSCAAVSMDDVTCYVTLEPCNHHGRTPPCTEAIISAGIRRVVIAVADPNPEVEGGGVRRLEQAGVKVEMGCMAHAARSLYESWSKWITVQLPFVLLKMGTSLDGKVATVKGETRWITSPQSRKMVHRIRNEVAGIMVGRGTVASDNPSLTARSGRGITSTPTRIITDSTLSSPLESQIFKKNFPGKTIIATVKDADIRRIEGFESRGVEVIGLARGACGVDLKELMQLLGKRGIESILLEGGPRLAFSMLQEGLVDKVMIFHAPVIIGGQKAPSAVGGEGFPNLISLPRLSQVTTRRIGGDVLIQGYLSP